MAMAGDVHATPLRLCEEMQWAFARLLVDMAKPATRVPYFVLSHIKKGMLQEKILSQELVTRYLRDHGWRHGHIYRGQPTWVPSVDSKRLVIRDEFHFLREEGGEMRERVRRAQAHGPMHFLGRPSLVKHSLGRLFQEHGPIHSKT